jgi:hypothetical protein
LRGEEGSDAFGTAASVARIFATVITALVVSVFYADVAYGSDTTADSSSSESTIGVAVDTGTSESSGTTAPIESPATTPPSGSETTTPPPDPETTTPPPDPETTTPPPDPETTTPPPDPEATPPPPDPEATPPDSAPTDGSGDSSGSDPATGPDDTTSETPPVTDPVEVPPDTDPVIPPGDSQEHGDVAASSGPFPDVVSPPGPVAIQTTPSWGGASPLNSTGPLSPPDGSQSQPSSSTRGGGNGKTVPEPRGSAAIVGGLVETFASGGGAASGASASGSGSGATALLTAFLVLFAAVFARAVRLFSLPPRQLVLIADLERPD